MFYRNYRFICPRGRFLSSTQDFYRNTQEILNSGIFLMKQHCRKGFVNTERVQNSTTHKDSCRWPKCGRNCRLFLVNYLFHVLHLHCIVINKLIFVKLFDLTKHVLSSKQGLARIKAFLLSPNLTVYSVNCTSVQYSYPPTLTAVLKGCGMKRSNSKKRRYLRQHYGHLLVFELFVYMWDHCCGDSKQQLLLLYPASFF